MKSDVLKRCFSSDENTVNTFYDVLGTLDFDQVYRLGDSKVDKESGCMEDATRSGQTCERSSKPDFS